MTVRMPKRRPRILCIDDDENLLFGLKRVLHQEFTVTTANGGVPGVKALREAGPFAVVMSDMRMPGIDGNEVLSRAREIAPYTVRVLLTGQANLDDAISAVNRGHIFRFMTKPCSPAVLIDGLRAAVDQHDLLVGERVLLERTLNGSIRALTEVLALAQPAAFGRAARARRHVVDLVAHLQVADGWLVEMAATLSQIGCITLPPETATRVYDGTSLSPQEEAMVGRVPEAAVDILGNIPRLEPVTEILRYQQKRFDGGGRPADEVRGRSIPWGARALKVALDFDALVSQGLSASAALELMRDRGSWYDPTILQAFAEIRSGRPDRRHFTEVHLADVLPGMVFSEDVRAPTGALLIARGQEVTPSLAIRLRNLGAAGMPSRAVRMVLPTIADEDSSPLVE